MKYCVLNKDYQRRIVLKTKEKLKCGGFRGLAKKLNISKTTLLRYYNGEAKIPYYFYNKLSRIIKIKENPKLMEISHTRKEILKPILDKYLSEFLGIMAGDGHVSGISYEVSVTGHMVYDRGFITKHVVPLFIKLFDILPSIQIQHEYNKIKCLVYSKKMVDFLNQNYNLPIGSKDNKLRIPQKILNDRNLVISFIRGVFDTDGSFHRHHEKDAAIELISGDKRFLNDLYLSLKLLNFHPSIGTKRLFLYRKDEIDKFFNVIKPANTKHLKKYQIYKNTGKVPLLKRR